MTPGVYTSNFAGIIYVKPGGPERYTYKVLSPQMEEANGIIHRESGYTSSFIVSSSFCAGLKLLLPLTTCPTPGTHPEFFL